MQVFITGGAGFIGSNLGEFLLADGHRVAVVDDLEIKRRNLSTYREIDEDRFEFLQGSITDKSLVEEVVASRDVDVIFHEAAKAGVRSSVKQPKEYNENTSAAF